MKTVYRVQHTEINRGPYTSNKVEYIRDNWWDRMTTEHAGSSHPNLWEDYHNQIIGSEYLFGFDSLDKLKSWFDGYLFNLIDAGFIIAEYEVDDYIIGISGKQVVFIPTTFKDITLTLIQTFRHEDSHISQGYDDKGLNYQGFHSSLKLLQKPYIKWA